MYHQQQNKWYSRRCLLAHFEATFYFSGSEFTLLTSSSNNKFPLEDSKHAAL